MSKFPIGQMNQLGDALEKAGFSPEDVDKLQQFKDLAKVKAVLCGLAQIVTIKHIIDCDAAPFVPDGWEVEEHIKGGQVEWDPARIELYLHENQKAGKSITGQELRKQLANKPVMNANILDFLLAHPEIIPEELKGKVISFWGTIFRNPAGFLYVRYLCWYGGGWRCGYDRLDCDFYGDNPALLYK